MIYQSRSLRSLRDDRLRRMPLAKAAATGWGESIVAGLLSATAILLMALL